MGTADLVCLVLYLVLVVGLGLYAARRVRRMSDFFMPRRFGKAMMVMHSFGTGTHSDQAVSVAAKTFTNGLSGIWYQWLWLFCTPFYWVIAPVMRRFRAITTGDVFAARYGRSVAGLFAVVGMLQMSVTMGVMLKGSGAVIEAGTGLRSWIAVAVMTALFVAYGVAGGLASAIITDFVQGLLTVVFSFLLLPFAMEAVGGMAGLREKIADPAMFSLVAPGDISLFYIVVIAFNALVGIVAQPHIMGNCAAGRTETEGRVGWMFGNFIKRVCTMAWCLTGLAAVAYLAGRRVHPDEVYGVMARDFLPRAMPGLLGVFLASLLASVMSSCDSFMIASAALFTENLYRPLVRGRPDRHYLRVGRVAALVVVAGGVLIAFLLPSVVRGLEWFWKISPTIGIAFWLGLFWRRTTVAGAWAATLVGLGACEMRLPWQMVCYLAAGTAAGIGVSLLTRPVPSERLERFYALVRTPVAAGEVVEEPCTLPADREPAPRRVLLDRWGLEIPVPSAVSVAGFLGGWALVAAMIAGFYWITQ